MVVCDTKLFACLAYDGCDERVVGLVDSREQMVSCLVVESSCEKVPKPTVCGIV